MSTVQNNILTPEHKVVSREQWTAARFELLKAEKELTRRSDELARRRQELPWVRIDKQYRFETDEGSAWLADLFRGRSQLLIYHFMFGPDYKAGCATCSTIADGFNGFAIHLANHDVTLSAVSRAPLAVFAGANSGSSRYAPPAPIYSAQHFVMAPRLERCKPFRRPTGKA